MINSVSIAVLIVSIIPLISNMPNISHFQNIMNYQRFMQYHWFETVNSLLGVCNTQVAMKLKYSGKNLHEFIQKVLTCCAINSRIPTSSLCEQTNGYFKTSVGK